MRCLGIDYGTRRIGLAFGDDLGVATPLPALVDANPAKRWLALAAVIKLRRITEIVIGHPLNMDGTAGPKAREVEAVADRLRSEFQVPVHLADERLTSYEAEETLAPARLRALRSSGLVDSRAAAILLRDYFEERFPRPPSEGPPWEGPPK